MAYSDDGLPHMKALPLIGKEWGWIGKKEGLIGSIREGELGQQISQLGKIKYEQHNPTVASKWHIGCLWEIV